MMYDDLELKRSVNSRLLLELNMVPFSVVKITTDGRVMVDNEALASWLTPAVYELMQLPGTEDED